MLKINLVAMGDIKENYLVEAIKEYSKRLSRFCNLKIIQLKENVSRTNNTQDILGALKKDAELIVPHLSGHVICLDINAKMYSSEQFSEKIKSISLSKSEITFVIGASNGLSEDIKNKCHEKMSFSPMTFPHQLMRVIFLEQLYRSFTILNNISYHK